MERNTLLKGIDQQEAWAYEAVFREYYPRLCLFASRYFKAKEDAEDAVSEVFAKSSFMGRTFHDPNQLRSFLYKAVHFMCCNTLRHGRQQAEMLKVLVHSEEEDNLFHRRVIEAEVAAQVRALMQKTLPGKCLAVCRKFFFEGKSVEQIAEEMRTSISTVRNQKHRGLKLLREQCPNWDILFIALCCVFP